MTMCGLTKVCFLDYGSPGPYFPVVVAIPQSVLEADPRLVRIEARGEICRDRPGPGSISVYAYMDMVRYRIVVLQELGVRRARARAVGDYSLQQSRHEEIE